MFKIIGADGKEYGPVDVAQLRAWVTEGRADSQTLVKSEGDTEWKTLAALPEFSSLPKPPSPSVASHGVIVPTTRTNGFATAGMIMGILSLTLCFCCYGFPFNILGLIFSLVALSQINRSPEIYDGRGIAIAGLVLSCVSIVFSAIMMFLGIAINLSSIEHGLNQ
jgi:hypothetical protein